MNKEQFKRKRQQARICHNSIRFHYYDEREPIPEVLQPYLLQLNSSPSTMSAVNAYKAATPLTPDTLEWFKARIRCNYSGVFKKEPTT